MCMRSFCWSNPTNKHLRERVWFVRWIVEGYTVRQLAKQSGHSRGKIQQIIQYWLTQEPPQGFIPHQYLVMDGSFLERRMYSVFAVMNGDHRIVDGKYQIREEYRQLTHYFQYLESAGLCPTSATVDGNPAITRALRGVWPKIIIQRCLVHVQRQGLQWCRRNPKRTDAKKLRQLLLCLTGIHTISQRNIFLRQLQDWERRYGLKLACLPPKGWVLTDVQRARSMVIHALPQLFPYLQDNRIPRTTNSIEGYFSRLKLRYRQHRGLSRQRRAQYFKWYFHLVQR